MNTWFLGPAVATVLTVYGIETEIFRWLRYTISYSVATVLTVYGIETNHLDLMSTQILLQQCLPFTVLKLVMER